MIISNLSHETLVARVDKLVSDILNPESGISFQQISEQLTLYYQPMTQLYNDDLEYVDSIKWLIGSCYLVCGSYYPDEVIWDEAMTFNFLQALKLYQNEFGTAISEFAFQEQRNSQSLKNYMNHFLNKYARILIVRVDLKIRSNYAHLVDIETFQDYMSQLLEQIQKDRKKTKKQNTLSRNDKGCFEDLRGYAWAIEQGVVNGGLHCHLLLIYNGDKRQADWFIGERVAEYWLQITGNLGWYHNCNTQDIKEFHRRQGTLGVGMIRRNSELDVRNALNTALYLTRPDKYEQRLKAWPPNMRSFGRGTMPRA